MARQDWIFNGYGIEEIADLITSGILKGSISASLEDSTYFSYGDVSCIVLVFERYSIIGSNRLSLTVTLFSEPGRVRVSGKVNTLGKNAFIDALVGVLSSIS